MRAFLAIPLSDAMKDRYATVHPELKSRFGRLNWVEPRNLHLTMRFLGDIEERTCGRLEDAVATAVSRVPPFRLAIGRPGCFGPQRVPRTLWIAVEEGRAAAESLAGLLESAARCLRFPAERKPWNSHVTLARNPRHAAVEGWEEIVEASGLEGLGLDVGDVTLFSSTTLPAGPVYSVVWKARLGAGDPARAREGT